MQCIRCEREIKSVSAVNLQQKYSSPTDLLCYFCEQIEMNLGPYLSHPNAREYVRNLMRNIEEYQAEEKESGN